MKHQNLNDILEKTKNKLKDCNLKKLPKTIDLLIYLKETQLKNKTIEKHKAQQQEPHFEE